MVYHKTTAYNTIATFFEIQVLL